MAQRPLVMGNLHPTYPQIPSFRQLMKIYSESDPVHIILFGSKKSVLTDQDASNIFYFSLLLFIEVKHKSEAECVGERIPVHTTS